MLKLVSIVPPDTDIILKSIETFLWLLYNSSINLLWYIDSLANLEYVDTWIFSLLLMTILLFRSLLWSWILHASQITYPVSSFELKQAYHLFFLKSTVLVSNIVTCQQHTLQHILEPIMISRYVWKTHISFRFFLPDLFVFPFFTFCTRLWIPQFACTTYYQHNF